MKRNIKKLKTINAAEMKKQNGEKTDVGKVRKVRVLQLGERKG